MNKITATTNWESEFLLYILQKIEHKNIYLEIGSLNGDSLKFMSQILNRDSIIISIDSHELGDKIKLQNTIKQLNKKHVAYLISQDSKNPQTIQKVKNILRDNLIDILFIDGDHSLYGIASDIYNYTPLVRNNGIIMFHDCGKLNGAKHGRKFMAEVGGCFQGFIFEKPYILLQEYVGIGLVWNKKMETLDRYKKCNQTIKGENWH